MSKRSKENAKRIAECMLAVVLVCALMIPAGVSGVFAKEDAMSTDVAAARIGKATQPEEEALSKGLEEEKSVGSAKPIDSEEDAVGSVEETAAVAVTADADTGKIANQELNTFYVDQGNVTFGKDGVTGYVKNADGAYESQTIPHDENAIYVVSQSDSSNMTTNHIEFVGNQSTPYHVVINDVNMGRSNPQYIYGETQGADDSLEGMILIPACSETKKVYLYLAGVNVLNGIRYYTGEEYGHYPINRESFLCIDGAEKIGMSEGQLYIPEKVEEADIPQFVSNSNLAYNRWNAGIGGTDKYSIVTGLTISGGEYQVLSTVADNCSAIGGGGNGDAEIAITGGRVTAVCSGTGAAIGGGIGYTKFGGKARVSISNGTIYAMNYGKVVSNSLTVGGVAIGGGSSLKENGSSASVDITGGDVSAYAMYGNGIGSGNSARSSSDQAKVHIGGGAVKTNAIGGGSSESDTGGSALIQIDGGTTICESLYDNYIGAYGIGGGFSKQGNGGDADVVVAGGSMDCGTGTIGGGTSATAGNGGNANIVVSDGELRAGTIGGGNARDSQGTYKGGDASIYVSGGTLNCASIGGGNSTNGKPGSVTSDTQTAGVVVTDGTLLTGTIGGGTNDKGEIGFATADISGGQIQGQFILANTDASKQCFFKMTGGTIDNNGLKGDKYHTAQANGGAVYLSDPKGSVDISGGIIQNTSARLGGAVYMTGGAFALSGTAEIRNCYANDISIGSDIEDGRGGAVYLENGTVVLNGGCIHNSIANQGGAVYLGNGDVTLSSGAIGKQDSPNQANKGAGVYVAGGTLTVDGGSIAYNEAKNGGGVYMADGDLTVSGGSITGNRAVDGAGAYLQQGNLTVSGSGDFSGNIASQNGAGAYLAGGALTLNSGTFNSNTATGNGGGAYLAGGVLTINGGSIGSNAAQNGAGAYAADGKVRMFGGFVTNNTAAQNGGGLYVSSDSSPADVIVRSGSITNNSAVGNGGGIAVAGTGSQADQVTIGVLETHTNLDIDSDNRTFTAFDYTDSADSQTHNHASCPVLSGNKATGNGGGVYMGSSMAVLNVYCLMEQGNTSVADPNGNSVMTEGGTVLVGDRENTDADNAKNARGNVRISSSMLVSGGDVKIYGNMKNPDFTGTVLVNIQEHSGTFNDYRKQADQGGSGDQTEVEYKIHYYENFKENEGDSATGIFSALQYKANEKVTAAASVFVHVGWKIVGWATETDLNLGKITYEIGATIGDKDDHKAWGSDNTAPLKLYAVWQRTVYTVEFNANVAPGQSYTGNMDDQTFTYGQAQALTPNAYKVAGKRFNGWNLTSGGTGLSYADGYSGSKITDEDGAKVALYAQWVDCTHDEGGHPGTVTYSKNDGAHSITETCNCGGHTVTVTLSAADVWVDGKTHAATLTYAGGSLLGGAPDVTYSYRNNESGVYGDMPVGETVPTSVGYYQASITVGEQTVTVEYQIKSPAAGTTIEAKIAAGEQFTDFAGASDVNVSAGGSFTVQFDVHGLETSVYNSEPQLTFGGANFAGASVIMQADDGFWYANVPDGGSLKLSDFKKMGDGASYTYSAANSQACRFIVDVPSGVSASNASALVSLSYEPNVTGSTELKTSANLTVGSSGAFSLQANGDSLTVSAPAATVGSGWENHEQVLVLSGADDAAIPADAKLSVLAGGVTTVYAPNQNGQFIVPLAWATSQGVSFALSSSSASAAKSYSLNASLFAGPTRAAVQGALIGAKEGNVLADATGLTLTIPSQVAPSLKLTGTERLFDRTADTLAVTVATENLDGSSISATVQKRSADGSYTGTYLSASDVTAGQQSFSLANVKDEGSYRLLATVTKNNQKLLEVPYYFVVK